MQTLKVHIDDSVYSKLIKSGIDIEANIQSFLEELLDDGYPAISTNEAKKRVCDAVDRYHNGTGEYLNAEQYQSYINQTMQKLELKYGNH